MTEPQTPPETTRRPGARDGTAVVHHALREAILRGEIAAGTSLSQVKIAKDFGISRGPVREALRLLQREGLIEAELNRRVRVAHFSVEDLEQLYATRVVVEALAISVSVPRFTEEDLTELNRALADMDRLAGHDVERWDEVHRGFHLALVAHAGERMLRLIEQLVDHGERYRRVYIAQGPRAWSVGAAEHAEIVAACVDRDASLAAALLARHLSRTALTVFMLSAPEYDPAILRAAIGQATSAAQSQPTAGVRLPTASR
jgi:DNA-binding GntR family transcriptional regulator